jgi:hypothetical protein
VGAALLALAIAIAVVGASIAASVAARAETPREALAAYQSAWERGDCAGYQAVTTPEFRQEAHADCAAFEAARSSEVQPGVEVEYLLEQAERFSATFGTRETWTDENGAHEVYYLTQLVDDQGWRIYSRAVDPS